MRLSNNIGELKISEQRGLTDEHVEIIVLNEEIAKWDNIVSSVLGPAVKPEGENPSKDDKACTEDLGGIFASQTLFKKQFNDHSILAMFWPWGDQVHTTIKIFLLPNLV